MKAKGWITREILPRRQRRLLLTPEGEALLRRLLPSIRTLNRELLRHLDAAERRELIRLLSKFVHLSNDDSRAPLRRTDPAAAGSDDPEVKAAPTAQARRRRSA